MTLFKALSLSEELNCSIVHHAAGLKASALTIKDPWALPQTGWCLDDTPVPVEFEAKFLGCDLVDTSLAGGIHGAIYSFEGLNIHTLMPSGTLVKVRIEPQ